MHQGQEGHFLSFPSNDLVWSFPSNGQHGQMLIKSPYILFSVSVDIIIRINKYPSLWKTHLV